MDPEAGEVYCLCPAAAKAGSSYLETLSAVLRGARRAARALRPRGPLAGDATAQILNTLLVGVLCWAVFDIAVIIPFFAANKLASTLQASCVVLIFAIALALLYRGWFRAASLVYLSGIWLLATIAIALTAGIHSPGLIFYLALPISAAWLLGYRAALLCAGICLATSLTMAVLEMNGLPMPRYLPGRPLGVWASIVVAMIVAAVPVAHVLQTLKEALVQSESAKEALRESEERFRNVADTAPVMICASGPDKLATFFNAGWLTFTGRTMEQELGYGWTAGVHPDDLDDCLARYSASFESRRRCHIEYRLRRADGEYRSVVCNGVPRFTPDGVFAGYIASCVDITEAKRAQEETLARQKLESVGVLARGIAHDFNNLLGGILAITECALAERGEASPPEEELLTIRTAAIRGGEIVRQLMTYGGEESSAFEPIDLSLLVEEMLQLLKVSISKHAILETELGAGLPAVPGNPAQIRQVVMNLVTNASEAIGERAGVIRVTTTRVRVGLDAHVTGVANLSPGDYLKLEVSDTGGGMTPEVQTRIFDPFFTTKSAGRGLGLAAVQGIVRSHLGAIKVESSLAQGTRFEVFLPSTDQQVQRIPMAAQASASESARITGAILVVEDEDMLRLAVSKMLRKRGLPVLEATDGNAAVDLFRANEPDIAVVLLDVTLPGMSGLEVFAELRRIRPDIKVIITTAYGQETTLPTVGVQQSSAFIRKPYQLNDLWNLIWAVCRQKGSAHAASDLPAS
jgi:two-component system cell cycle sensor histidine kinase/response regulator CckA